MINDGLIAWMLIIEAEEETQKQKLLHWYRECIVAAPSPFPAFTARTDIWLDAT